jgi:hypothetical protein
MKQRHASATLALALAALGCTPEGEPPIEPPPSSVSLSFGDIDGAQLDNFAFGFFEANDLRNFIDEDLDGDGRLDVREDANDNGVLDKGEDLDEDQNLDLNEDTNGNGVLDVIFSDLNNDGIVNDEDTVTSAGLFVIASDSPTLCEDLANARFFPLGANSLFFFLEQFDVRGGRPSDVQSGNILSTSGNPGGVAFTKIRTELAVLRLDGFDQVFGDGSTVLTLGDFGDTLTLDATGLLSDGVTTAPLSAHFESIARCPNADQTAEINTLFTAILSGLRPVEP